MRTLIRTLGRRGRGQPDAVAAGHRRGPHPRQSARSDRCGRRPTVSTSSSARTPTNTGCSWPRRARSSTSPMCRLQAPSRRTDSRSTTLAAYRAAHPGAQRRRSARGHSNRLVLAHPRDPPGRGACETRRTHLHVRVRLALAAVRRAPGCVPCARSSLRVRHAWTPHEPLRGPTPPQQLADTMHAAWVGFATNGRCSWPRYDATRRATMRFDVASKVVEGTRDAEQTVWESAFAASR